MSDIVSYATSAEADFETMRWIFDIEPGCRVFAGRCAILPADDLAILQSQRDEMRAAINAYYAALDRSEHDGIAQDKAFKAIESALGMHWVQGQSLSPPAIGRDCPGRAE